MKNINKIMEFWYFVRAILGGAAVVLLFMLIRKLSNNKEEKTDSTEIDSKPSDKDLKESLEIVRLLGEIYKL